jgi:hypothetical protein
MLEMEVGTNVAKLVLSGHVSKDDEVLISTVPGRLVFNARRVSKRFSSRLSIVVAQLK